MFGRAGDAEVHLTDLINSATEEMASLSARNAVFDERTLVVLVPTACACVEPPMMTPVAARSVAMRCNAERHRSNGEGMQRQRRSGLYSVGTNSEWSWQGRQYFSCALHRARRAERWRIASGVNQRWALMSGSEMRFSGSFCRICGLTAVSVASDWQQADHEVPPSPSAAGPSRQATRVVGSADRPP